MKKMKRAAMLLGCLCMLCFTALHIAAADVPDPTEDFLCKRLCRYVRYGSEGSYYFDK